ncbi:uncharacterized protein LOC117223279 isoform X8 [Megalopta genalis]|uniref:uncharacterized protein LOC117223279 isoform X8 n=1 Tax=Megalopta genalis TaxID=115081 RepID=UPI003FD61276
MSIAVAENAGPSPCELQDPLRVKMSAITGSITKKRKKSDAKPQSQINKCLNEKRRRTQENLFIDELTELIFPTDMSSGKTDKCQILQRTVDQIRHIRQQEGSNSHAVQQGEVSSSNRNILSNDQVGSIVLEALDGFLFIVNTEGRVEYVTENITQYINYTKDDVLGKDIYNIIHHGDHNTFMPSLLPISLGWTSEPQPQRNRTFNCRFLVKPPDDKEETMEEKQQRVSKYESMQICSALLPSNSDRLESGDVSSESSDIGPSVMCVARRIPPNEKPIGSLIEQFTVKLDTTGKIITVDTSGLSLPYSKYLNKVRDLIGTTIKDLCHPHDLSKLTAHLNDTLQVGRSTSDVYRLRVSPDKFLNIQTNSKLFKANVMNSTDFIMATNSIIGPLQESQTSSLTNSAASSVSANGAAGLTPKRQDEGKTGCSTTNQSAMEAANARNNATSVAGTATAGGQSSAASATIETQNSVVTTGSGRLRNLLTKGASGSEDSQDNTNNDSNSRNKHPILSVLLDQQDEDDFHPEHNNKVRTSPSNVPKPSMEHSKSTLGNNMLLQLLKTDDEDEESSHHAGVKKKNELLHKLLNDQDDERKVQEQQCKPQTREEDKLLHSLGFRNTTPSPSQSGDNVRLGGSSQVGQKRPGDDGDLNIAVKRPMDGSHQVSSSGTPTNATSKLWEKNKMLARLLAQQPPQATTIPPIPASVISATPQDKLVRIKQQPPQPTQPQPQQQQQAQQQQQQPWTGGSMQSVGGNNTITTTATSARTPLQSQSRQLPRPTTNTYLNHMLSQQQRPQIGQMDSEFTGSGEHHQTNTDPSGWDNQSSDPDLSDILDQVIEFVPDEAITDSSAIANLLDVIETPQNNVLNEKMAISAIQKSLMLCETAVNPTSSTITIPGTPPAYSTALTTPVTTSHSYQPPPMYQQQTRMRNTTQLVRQNTAQFTQQQQLQLHQQRAKIMQQQQQQQQLKQRLLQQQQQQQLLIPSNATATDQITTGIQNIDNLLNNTVAPNVSLQRSSVPDSQVSPGYGGSVQMPSSGHRLAHSYSHPSTLPQHPIVNNNFNSGQQVSAAARLSPHSPAGILSFSHPQPLSPRVTQGNYGNTPRLFNVNQVRTQQQPTTQQQLQQQQRSMSSPGTPASARQSPFPAETFPPPTSPTASQFPPGPNPGAPNPSAQYRLQRTTSTPSATTQLPGGLGSPRHYGGVSKEQPLLSPSHPHSGCPATPTHNQHNVTNTQQHFSNQQHSSMIYHTTANTINTADMQNNQFCYDRTSVPLYSSGPGDTQDARSLPPGNPVNHQLGGNASSTSEFVRQELRAIVGARTQQQQQQRVPNNLQNNLPGQVSQDDLDALGLNFEMGSPGEAVVSDGPAKSWAIGSAGSAPSSSRTSTEEVARGDPKVNQSSLLQKLLSE